MPNEYKQKINLYELVINNLIKIKLVKNKKIFNFCCCFAHILNELKKKVHKNV